MCSKWSSAFLAALALLGVMASGCASPGAIGGAPAEEAAPPPLMLSAPDPDASVLSLIGREGPVRLGETYETILREFPRPTNASEVRDASPSVGTELLSRGWDTGTQAFAALSQNDRVVLMINSVDRTGEPEVRELVRQYEAHLGRVADSIVDGAGPPVNYWFWQTGDQRLMICQAVNASGRMSVTVVLGLAPLMDRLRMNVVDARSDRRTAQRALESAAAPANTTAPAPGP